MPDAQVSGLLTPSMWCLNTKHVMGWDEDASRASWQTNSFKKYGVVLHRFATATSNQLIASCNLYFG